MKLLNKKTGEVINSKELLTDDFIIDLFCTDFDSFNTRLHKILEEWEVFEEYKIYWYVNDDGEVMSKEIAWFNQQQVNIGNQFETKEEAEKAVEKLKAFKRLKDKGMIKYSFHKEKTGIDLDFYTLTILAPRDKDSLNLLFGGEE